MTAPRAALAAVLAVAACDWSLERMNDQPRCEPGDSRPWLPDRRCDQEPPPGTVAHRSHLQPSPVVAPTREVILRGADRYARFCAPCHGLLGDAQTPVARDMTLRRPPSLHDPLIVGYTDARLHEVITSGYGMMPSYSYQLDPPDRWAVVHYVRVLQVSQGIALRDLPARRREEVQQWLP